MSSRRYSMTTFFISRTTLSAPGRPRRTPWPLLSLAAVVGPLVLLLANSRASLGEERSVGGPHQMEVSWVLFSPDGKTLVTPDAGGFNKLNAIRLIDVATGE